VGYPEQPPSKSGFYYKKGAGYVEKNIFYNFGRRLYCRMR
jgi:hypothetical protein